MSYHMRTLYRLVLFPPAPPVRAGSPVPLKQAQAYTPHAVKGLTFISGALCGGSSGPVHFGSGISLRGWPSSFQYQSFSKYKVYFLTQARIFSMMSATSSTVRKNFLASSA